MTTRCWLIDFVIGITFLQYKMLMYVLYDISVNWGKSLVDPFATGAGERARSNPQSIPEGGQHVEEQGGNGCCQEKYGHQGWRIETSVSVTC